MFFSRFLLLILIVMAGVLESQETASEQGEKLLQPFKQNLQQALQEGLAKGPVDAVTACQLQAPGIASDLSSSGVRLGRTSHRLRNSANIAPEWVAPILDAYASDSSNRRSRSVSLKNNKTGYIEPITIKPLCLTCHGDSIAPEITSKIDELYPEDQAVGYQAGDLRGVFWIEFPASE